MALTNVVAEGVNTVGWLAEAVTTIAVPVYQRHYRWDVDPCSRLPTFDANGFSIGFRVLCGTPA